ncbi:hypothetical protein [Aeoliella mucimassa]|nr:hypothetical protein [Aeoliella mucimassa]
MSVYRAFSLLSLATLSLLTTGTCLAEDYFLTIGGGTGATNNQLSIERNVIFQQNVLSEKRPDNPTQIVLFSDGDNPAPDVQARDPDFAETCPPARRLMAELLSDEDPDLIYRTHQVPNVEGPSDKGTLKRRLRQLSGKLKAGDRLIIYATGHGGGAESPYDYYYYDEEEEGENEYNEYDTSFYFYDSENVTASEFTSWLDRVPADVEVMMVMVQCYAGGFAHTIFHQADQELGVSSHARCGFFAQVHDRGAAGCTPNANESEYQEYSSYFWGALAGRTRTGEESIAADYNEDGKVSFAEAHAYAIIESETLDIPVRTSDAFLRHYSALGKKASSDDSEDEGSLGTLFGFLANKPAVEKDTELRKLEGSIAEIAKLARADQRAILEQLPEKLELPGKPTVESVRLVLAKVEAEQGLANVKRGSAYERYTNARMRVSEELLETWPELNASYSPLSMALVAERAEEFQEKVQGLASYEAYSRAKERREQYDEEAEALVHREAKLQRLLHTCESVVLEANLPKLMPQEMVDRYEKMVLMENGSL